MSSAFLGHGENLEIKRHTLKLEMSCPPCEHHGQRSCIPGEPTTGSKGAGHQRQLVSTRGESFKIDHKCCRRPPGGVEKRAHDIHNVVACSVHDVATCITWFRVCLDFVGASNPRRKHEKHDYIEHMTSERLPFSINKQVSVRGSFFES